MPSSSLLVRFAPVLFVLIWATGWINAKVIVPHADPLWFLSIRFALAGLLLAAFAGVVGAPWPSGPRAWMHALLAGVLLHGLYLGGVWWSVRNGVPAGISGLLAALQPLVTAMLAPSLLNERMSARQWIGTAVGCVGVMLVIAPKLGLTGDAAVFTWGVLSVNILGTLALTAGTFYQKRYVSGGDLRTVTAVQYLGATLLVLPIALLTESLRFDGHIETFAALAWSVLVLSIGGIGLMLMMINRGQVTRVSALNYLVPTVVAIMAWGMFGETLNALQMMGMALTAVGVYLAARAPA